MKVYNTLSAKKEEFVPVKDNEVRMYVCGPTVYDYGHLGHGRSAMAFDVIRRFFIYKGYDVKFVSNYTDIDDKMINRANIAGISVKELSEKIIPEYRKDYDALHILEADFHPLATEYVDAIIDIIKKLEENGYTYVISDGVYYDVSKFKEYGKLSKQKLEDLRAGARVVENTEKRNPQDFVLWKFYKEGEPFWESPWGKGRPGWHIECSAMSWKLLGETFDIHGGGADLIFPHHECEIAQSEGAFNKPFVNYWMHNGFINVNNEKMSKSLGNFFTLKDIFKEFNPLAVRLLFLQTHYRSPIEFSRDILKQAENGLNRINVFFDRLNDLSHFSYEGINSELVEFIENGRSKFILAMEDDFDTPKAVSVLFDFIRFVNKLIDEDKFSVRDRDISLAFLKELDEVFALLSDKKDEDVLEDKFMEMIKVREEARKNRDWETADKIRDELKENGILLEDVDGVTKWKRV